MALFHRGLPRRAVAGAFLAFLYGLAVMPVGFTTGSTATAAAGAGWALLSLSLLFGRPFSYYAFLAWSLLWIAWKGIEAWRAPGLGIVLDVLVPLVALALVSSSGYVESLRAPERP